MSELLSGASQICKLKGCRLADAQTEIERLRAENKELRTKMREMSGLAMLALQKIETLIEMEITEAGREALAALSS
jgi:hypothetical protein